jgi:hypothetical protein
VIGKDEDWSVVRRIVTPPAFPAVVGPGSPDRSEHIPPHNPSPDILEAPRRKLVVNSGGAAIGAKHVLKSPCGEGPLMQLVAADAERMIKILVRSGTVAVKG